MNKHEDLIAQLAWAVIQGITKGEKLTTVMEGVFNRVHNALIENGTIKKEAQPPKPNPAVFSFESVAKPVKNKHNVEILGVWTDGLSITSEYEPGWAPAYRFKKDKTYRITITEVKSKT